jgi:hypothetical protein
VPEPVALPAPSRKLRRKRGAEAKASPLLPDEQGESPFDLLRSLGGFIEGGTGTP